VDRLKSPGKPFEISKRAVWEAWEKVKANRGAPGVDGVTLEAFEKDLKNNLYRVWNRMSSGSYFPPPVRAVEIPKPHGRGSRTLGVPAVGDRVAQTVVAQVLGGGAEPLFHRVGRGGFLPAALLEDGLGDRSGHPEILRHRAVGSGGQSG
jgi:retron-type reverse transcriptase